MTQPDYPKARVEELRRQVAYAERAKQVMDRIHAATDLDQIFVELLNEILSLFDAEHLTLYAVDYDKREIYSRFLDLDEIKEIRVPFNEQSVVGFVARNRKAVNLADAYDAAELSRLSATLSFDRSWDQRTGVRTRQMLTVPLCASNNLLTGILQLINKKSASRFTAEDESQVHAIGQTLGIALYNQYQLARKKPTRFDGLLAANLMSEKELEAAVAAAREKQRAVESVLMEKYRISKKDIGQSLSAFYHCPFLESVARLSATPELVKNLNVNYLKANYWIPLKQWENTIEILTDDPASFQKLQDIRRIFPLEELKFIVGLRDDILQVISTVKTDLALNTRTESLSTILGQLASETPEQESESPELVDENDNAIVRLANQMIIEAYRAGASDIHLEPYGDHKETVIRFRVDGNCYEHLKVQPGHRRALVSRLKIMARLDIAERRKPQDGKIKFRLPDREIELRVATIPTAGIGNEDIVMRILSASEPLPLDQLALSQRNLRELTQLLDKPYGIMLCVGPTGSGKTTTLHSALGAINTPDRKIWTAEDPVEITQYGLRQVQVHPRIGFTFAAAMRAFLRADPDVIMVGEIRDQETAEISIEASLTGHLVLSTLHTNSAVETITRLLEMGMDPFNFADALLGVLAQRLARTICQNCKEQYHPCKEEYDILAHEYGEEAFAALDMPYGARFVLFRGKGCEVCHHTGYKGRIGLHELLVSSEQIKRLIHTRATVPELLKVAIVQGMTTLVQDGILKTLQGWTDYNQVKAVAMR
ncbi:MAG TPA: GspE/PulE family protein [Candidatus Binatia bacterium]|jgi:type II secretory ATPase GspE/PulE/Tfp pilus assembly ATPase PilB-like protein|nr:GspE/PulE family protein [Candidatus Binatia bacterium]